jgi:hypothetical protein
MAIKHAREQSRIRQRRGDQLSIARSQPTGPV